MRKYKYNGKIYCNEKLDIDNYGGDFQNLLWDIEKDNPNIYSESMVTLRFIGNEYYGTEDDRTDEETLNEIIECGYEELEEVE